MPSVNHHCFVDSNNNYPGFLLAIEGIDGAGKTTQAHHVQEVLQGRGLVVTRTKEPTTGHYGQMLRDSALTGRLSLEEEIEIFMKDRKEHVLKVIRPDLEAGKIVIVDRYYFSTAAYQGAHPGIDPKKLIADNELFAPEPDLLVVIDVEPKLGLARIRTRGDRANHFEKTETLIKARQIFLDIEKPYKIVIDGNQTPEEIKVQIVRRLSDVYVDRLKGVRIDICDKLNETLKIYGAPPLPDKIPI
jgi:dTMP kinase